MLEGEHRPRWGLLGIFAAGFCLLVLPPVGSGSPSPTLTQLRANDADLAAKSRAAVLDLYSLDAQLTNAKVRLAALQAEEQKLREERASIGRQVRLARLDTRVSQSRLADRLRFLYEHGTLSTLDMVMGAKSLNDAMTQLDNFQQVASMNIDVLAQLHSDKIRLSRLSHELRIHERSLLATTVAARGAVAELNREQVDRTAYITQLSTQRSLNAGQINRLEIQAQAADALSQKLALSIRPVVPPGQASTVPTRTTAVESPASPTESTMTVSAGGRTLTVVATAYDLPGTTASGLPVGWGIVAVDPSVIPLGTHMIVPGYGEAVAADTGGAIIGSRIDLWFPTAAQAFAWGRRTVTIAFR